MFKCKKKLRLKLFVTVLVNKLKCCYHLKNFLHANLSSIIFFLIISDIALFPKEA